jgi:hypothetical protein
MHEAVGGKAQRMFVRVRSLTTWTEIGDIARRLLERDYPGKAVLHVAT